MALDTLDKQIVALALPALGALVAEPLFLLTDTAMIGHLGAEALASLGLASTILTTVIGLLIFLAYATTPIVARRLGAGRRSDALSAGIDGIWLALFLGIILGVVGSLVAPSVVGAFGASADVTNGALAYLSISWWGLPGMLVAIATTGLFRGLQDTKTPLVVAALGFLANIGLNAVLIYGVGLGLVGSAWGTVLAQWGMALVFVFLATKQALDHKARLRPGLLGIRQAAQSGGWLFVRTLSLRVALVLTVLVATGMGTAELATWHIAFIIFSLLALALDALAIAGQALIGHGLGQGDVAKVRLITNRLIRWGFLAGGVLAVGMGFLAPVIPFLMTSDAMVRQALWPVLLLMAIGLPLAGFVFVLDGILIGAGDGKYLAITGVSNLVAYVPFLWVAQSFEPAGGGVNVGGLLLVQAAFSFGYIGARALTLGLRSRGNRWMVPGDSH